MHRKYFIVVLIITFLSLILILSYFLGQKPPPQSPRDNISVVHPSFSHYIHGVGIVEPVSGNINIGIPFTRIVKHVNVSVNDKVKKGDVLLQLDHADLTAELNVKQTEYEKALANLHKLQALPRQQDLVIAEEALKKAQISLNELKAQYEMVANLPNPRAISKEEYDKRQYRYQQAEAELGEVQARFDKIKAGTWKPELDIAINDVEQAKAEVDAIKTEIQRTYIKSPIDGTVLQIKIHEGETSNSDPSNPAIILGNIDNLNLRVSIDQFNAANLSPNDPAVAFRQGDRVTKYPLEFMHVEPLMVPKKYLTNDVEEKVDTHVFEILYRITKKDPHLYIGERLDVFIDIEKK